MSESSYEIQNFSPSLIVLIIFSVIVMCRINISCCYFSLIVVGLMSAGIGIIIHSCIIVSSLINHESEKQDIGKLLSIFFNGNQFYVYTFLLGFFIKLGVIFYDLYRLVCLVRGVLTVNLKTKG